jgi:hypothetical protein
MITRFRGGFTWRITYNFYGSISWSIRQINVWCYGFGLTIHGPMPAVEFLESDYDYPTDRR